jgi:hypothetical protein
MNHLQSFAILISFQASILIYTFVYDTDARTFAARGGAVSLTRWYHEVPLFSQMLFLAGSQELLLIEKGGTARIFSLVTENMRLVEVAIVGIIDDV